MYHFGHSRHSWIVVVSVALALGCPLPLQGKDWSSDDSARNVAALAAWMTWRIVALSSEAASLRIVEFVAPKHLRTHPCYMCVQILICQSDLGTLVLDAGLALPVTMAFLPVHWAETPRDIFLPLAIFSSSLVEDLSGSLLEEA